MKFLEPPVTLSLLVQYILITPTSDNDFINCHLKQVKGISLALLRIFMMLLSGENGAIDFGIMEN